MKVHTTFDKHIVHFDKNSQRYKECSTYRLAL